MEQNSNISEDVRKRLDCIDWDAVKEKCGISREAVEKNAAVASQLAYGQYTDLIPGVAGDLSGSFSLRAYPQGEGEPWKVKMYTMERPKTEADTLFLYGAKIPGEKVKKNLLEKTDWLGTDGTRKYGFANANSGYPVELTVDGKKETFLVSIHQPTNRVVGIRCDQVRAFLLDEGGQARGKGIYGVQFSTEQAEALAQGKAIRMDGCKTKDGNTFSCYVQFDAASRQVVPCHPTWIKEALRSGTDLGLGTQQQRSEAAKREHKPAVVVEQKTVQKPAGRKM